MSRQIVIVCLLMFALLELVPISRAAHAHVQPLSAEPAWLASVNAARHQTGVAPVAASEALSAQCREHARYMAETGHLTHSQDLGRPYASPAGDRCARLGNAWLGPASPRPIWAEERPIADWLASPGHRLWLLYPTTPAFGFGFYSAATNSAGAALNVLSQANFRADTAFAGWPLRYPAAGQGDVPPGRYPITLSWRYLGPPPQVTAVSLTAADASPIAHNWTTELPAGHKGALITPAQDLPPGAAVTITVTGVYAGALFTQTWSYNTARR